MEETEIKSEVKLEPPDQNSGIVGANNAAYTVPSCKICILQFDSKDACLQHYNVTHTHLHLCEICYEPFTDSSTRDLHLQQHFSARQTCKLCNVAFKDIIDWRSHNCPNADTLNVNKVGSNGSVSLNPGGDNPASHNVNSNLQRTEITNIQRTGNPNIPGIRIPNDQFTYPNGQTGNANIQAPSYNGKTAVPNVQALNMNPNRQTRNTNAEVTNPNDRTRYTNIQITNTNRQTGIGTQQTNSDGHIGNPNFRGLNPNMKPRSQVGNVIGQSVNQNMQKGLNNEIRKILVKRPSNSQFTNPSNRNLNQYGQNRNNNICSVNPNGQSGNTNTQSRNPNSLIKNPNIQAMNTNVQGNNTSRLAVAKSQQMNIQTKNSMKVRYPPSTASNKNVKNVTNQQKTLNALYEMNMNPNSQDATPPNPAVEQNLKQYDLKVYSGVNVPNANNINSNLITKQRRPNQIKTTNSHNLPNILRSSMLFKQEEKLSQKSASHNIKNNSYSDNKNSKNVTQSLNAPSKVNYIGRSNTNTNNTTNPNNIGSKNPINVAKGNKSVSKVILANHSTNNSAVHNNRNTNNVIGTQILNNIGDSRYLLSNNNGSLLNNQKDYQNRLIAYKALNYPNDSNSTPSNNKVNKDVNKDIHKTSIVNPSKVLKIKLVPTQQVPKNLIRVVNTGTLNTGTNPQSNVNESSYQNVQNCMTNEEYTTQNDYSIANYANQNLKTPVWNRQVEDANETGINALNLANDASKFCIVPIGSETAMQGPQKINDRMFNTIDDIPDLPILQDVDLMHLDPYFQPQNAYINLDPNQNDYANNFNASYPTEPNMNAIQPNSRYPVIQYAAKGNNDVQYYYAENANFIYNNPNKIVQGVPFIPNNNNSFNNNYNNVNQASFSDNNNVRYNITGVDANNEILRTNYNYCDTNASNTLFVNNYPRMNNGSTIFNTQPLHYQLQNDHRPKQARVLNEIVSLHDLRKQAEGNIALRNVSDRFMVTNNRGPVNVTNSGVANRGPVNVTNSGVAQIVNKEPTENSYRHLKVPDSRDAQIIILDDNDENNADNGTITVSDNNETEDSSNDKGLQRNQHTKSHYCHTCNQFFCTETVYQQHNKFHNNIQLCPCNICDRAQPSRMKPVKATNLNITPPNLDLTKSDAISPSKSCDENSDIISTEPPTYNVDESDDDVVDLTEDDLNPKVILKDLNVTPKDSKYYPKPSKDSKFYPKYSKFNPNYSKDSKLNPNDSKVSNDVTKKIPQCQPDSTVQPPVFKCKGCGKEYKFKHVLIRHQQYNCEARMIKTRETCDICKKTFASNLQIKQHRKYCYDKTADMLYSCDQCNEKFPEKENLEYHKKYHENVCDICNKNFLKKFYLTRHKRIHSGERPEKCQFCKLGFLRRHRLFRHLEIEHNSSIGTQFRCETCGSYFVNKSRLINHKNTTCANESVKLKPFLCDVCNVRFSCKDKLSIHISNNHIQKFNCDICKKSYGTRTKIENHMEKHKTNEYNCIICKRKYFLISQLHLHERVHFSCHKPTFSCRKCDKKFLHYSTFVYHGRLRNCTVTMKKKVPIKKRRKVKISPRTKASLNKIYCDYCDMEFKESHELYRHKKFNCTKMQTHQDWLVCEYCNKIYWQRYKLNYHIAKKHSDVFKCNVCFKSFGNTLQLEKHKATHDDINSNNDSSNEEVDVCT